MARKRGLVALHIGLISSIVACVQVSLAIGTVHTKYMKQRADILNLLLLSDGRISRQNQLKRIKENLVPDDSGFVQDKRVIPYSQPPWRTLVTVNPDTIVFG